MTSDWERVAADPALLREVRAGYRGRGDALDELWWAEHPGTTAPSGRPDPSDETEAARRSLYRPGPAPEDRAGIERAAAERRQDAASAVDALRRADAARPAPGPSVPSVPHEAERAAEPGRQDEPAVEPADGPVDGARRRRAVPLPWFAGLLAAALVAGAAGGGALAREAARRAEQASRPDRAALAVYARERNPALDDPGADVVPPFLDDDTIRRLRSFSSIGTVLYAARTPGGRVCLLVVTLGTRTSSACTSEEGFLRGGLTVLTRATADPTDDSGRRPTEELELTWSPDDTVSITPLSATSAGA